MLVAHRTVRWDGGVSPADARPSHPPWLERLRDQWSADLIETHISWLLLTDDTVYKFKRPVKFSFIDYASLELRRHRCEEELRLGRRYADIYQGVTIEEQSGEPAVVMHRFDEALRADHVCASGELQERHIRGLVDHMLAVHADSPAAEVGGALGSPALTAQQIQNTLDELHRQPDLDVAMLQYVESWLHDEQTRLAPLIERRQEQGFIREGHGDLHLANVIIWHDEAVAFDGIEFDEGLRWIDLAQELGFTYADLLRHRQPALAAALVERWLMVTGDVEGLALMRLHACHKALVRVMVAGMQGEVHIRSSYLETAQGIVAAGVSPRLLITHGFSGSGKSTFARAHMLADPHAATVWLRADTERKRLHGIDPRTPNPASVGAGLYAPEATERTYARLAGMASTLLASGWSVVVDATFLDRARRDEFRAVARAAAAEFGIVRCVAPEPELRARIATRHSDVSDADISVLERQLLTTVPLAPDEQGDIWEVVAQQ